MDAEGGTKAINKLHGKAISKNGKPLVVELSYEVSGSCPWNQVSKCFTSAAKEQIIILLTLNHLFSFALHFVAIFTLFSVYCIYFTNDPSV